MKIVEAITKKQIEIAEELFREYQHFLNVDLCFQGFEEELATLPGKYAEPTGAILLAQEGDVIVGCVAVRALTDTTNSHKNIRVCEMKRLYVKESFQGFSAGRFLAETVIEKAKQLGYQKMKLDTLQRLEKAISLYKKLGFHEIEAYYENPNLEVVYLEIDLTAS
jgi:putative acetyltransferase